MSGETGFWDAVDALRAQRRRYAREAYGFVVGALGATVQALPEARRADAATRHLSGQELLGGVVALARREFGPMAPTVFAEWGVVGALDVGEIVFELVGCGQLSARPEDSIEDFRGGPDLMRMLAGDPSRPGPADEAPRDRPRRTA
ncbi:MAG TPA: Minf_1886 family protein [Candidatus Acidoferrales bacterium]|nr:Minf_1886 family protein [Candidatus Acidoferrales bacterium]